MSKRIVASSLSGRHRRVAPITFKHKIPNAGGISYLFCWHEQVDGIFLSCVDTRREDVCGRVIAAPLTWTSVSVCSLSDRRYIALLCSYTFSVLLLHRCVLFVFPMSLYHSQRTSTPRVCTSISVLWTKHKAPNAGGISYLFCWHEQVDGIFLSCVYTRREDVCGGVIAASFTWTSVSACALSDRRYIALCSYTFSVLPLHPCVLFVFPLSLYHSQRTSTPRVCMSISVGNRIDGIFLFCIEMHRSVLFVVTPSSCCPYNVQA